MESNYTQPATDEQIAKTVRALEQNGITVKVVNTAEEAKSEALSQLPEKAEVMTMTSITLDTLGLTEEINTSEKYNSVKKQLASMNRETDQSKMQKLGSAPEYAIGSVHAVTEDGHVLIASNTGSQLPAYVYGSNHVIWVVGTQKLVKNLDEGMKRIYEHVLPLESERAKKAYGVPGSFVSKMAIINREVVPNRITMILVKENLGF